MQVSNALCVSLVVAVSGALAGRALAQPLPEQPSPSPSPSHERPWARGVSADEQRAAQALFAAGNELLDSLSFARAAAKYREALAHWPHPAIHYNLALALIQLDQPVDAYLAVVEALRHGAAPLEPEQFRQALNYRKLLKNQVGEIELTSDQAGVVVTIDGLPVLTGPGTVRLFVRTGERQLVASKRGYRTIARALRVASDSTAGVRIWLFTERELTGSERRWAPWKPWAIVSGGIGLAAVSGALHYFGARANVKSFDDELTRACPDGCRDADPASPSSRLRRGALQQKLAWGGYVAGGLIAAAGITGLILNLPRKVRLDRGGEEMQLTFGPSLSAGAAGIGLSGTF